MTNAAGTPNRELMIDPSHENDPRGMLADSPDPGEFTGRAEDE